MTSRGRRSTLAILVSRRYEQYIRLNDYIYASMCMLNCRQVAKLVEEEVHADKARCSLPRDEGMVFEDHGSDMSEDSALEDLLPSQVLDEV